MNEAYENYSGAEIITAICNRLEDEKKLCYDSAIIMKLRELSNLELTQLVTSGDVDSWIRDRNKQKKTKQNEMDGR